ncbi:MAG: (deoxy)nucleoside triphosphate pyrophosphohydrolase [Micrococcaceae bacterium]
MKTFRVVAAIIQDGNKILATQRATGQFANGWEFPGGKIEQNEEPETALVREIREELDAEINVEEHFYKVDYKYPDFHLLMECYLCRLKGDFKLLEHKSAKWVTKETIRDLDWLPADEPVIEKLADEVM